MAFSEAVVERAWRRADGKCECARPSEGHPHGRCNRQLVWDNRGKEGQEGAWEANLIRSSGGDVPSNCEILCWACYKSTL